MMRDPALNDPDNMPLPALRYRRRVFDEEIDDARLRAAHRKLARFIARQNERTARQYLPIFERLENELASRDRQSQLMNRINEIAREDGETC